MYTASALRRDAQDRPGLWWLIPREFGAWTILATGYLTTLLVADALTPAALWLIPAVILLLMLKEPLERMLRSPGRARLAFAAVAGAEFLLSGLFGVLAERSAGAPLLYALPLIAAPLYAVAIALGFWSERWRTLRELVATVGLGLVVPGTWAALGQPANLAMAIVYAGVVLHFLYGVGFLRLQIIAKRTHMDAADVRQGTLLLAGSASAITLGVVVASMFGYLPIWAAVSLLPQMARAYLWLGGEQAWLNLRRMGRQEVVLAVSLMVIFALVAHA